MNPDEAETIREDIILSVEIKQRMGWQLTNWNPIEAKGISSDIKEEKSHANPGKIEIQ